MIETGSVGLAKAIAAGVDWIDETDDAACAGAEDGIEALLNGQTVAPRGSDAVLVLIDDQNSGRIAGKTSLTISVQTFAINGRVYDVNASAVTKASGSRGAQSAERIGGGAGLGAAIVQIATSGERVKVPSEARLSFTLKDDLSL